jgi:hypothetical protein
MSGKTPKSILKRNGSTKKNRRIVFTGRNNVAPNNLTTPAHVTGFNRTNPYSLAEGWQTAAEYNAAVRNSKLKQILEKSLGRYVQPYAYQDPHFIYPPEARANVASTADALAKINSTALKYGLPLLPQGNHVAINVKPATRRRHRR